MTRTQITLRPDQQTRLTEMSRDTGAPVAVLVRRALDQFLGLTEPEPKPRAPLPGQQPHFKENA
jgi:hypothetical protein